MKKTPKTQKTTAGNDGLALVIVESPTKAKTLNRFLAGRYRVIASQGHVMDLPSSSMGIDVEHDFTPKYVVIKKRKPLVKELKAEAKDVKELWLATDPDREGEAISWHLSNLLGEGKKVQRAVFHEITPHAIEEAFQHPQAIDMSKVNAQQARRVLDRLVGYSISPLLWQKVSRGLSAGRVQSVTVRLIVDREREIRAFKPREYWSIEATLTPEKKEHPFTAQLVKIGEEDLELKNQAQSDRLVEILKSAAYSVDKVTESQRKRNPLPPFTTSTLQQESYHKLRYSASRTMRIAQQLYEGIELGEEGPTGLITYMRTDSVRLAEDAEKSIRATIEKKFGKPYLPDAPRRYKSRKGAQEAHEAIRVTDIERAPENIKSYLTPDQLKLYQLIWSRTLASQMNPSISKVTAVDIRATAEKAKPSAYQFRATGTQMVFDGFTAAYAVAEEESDDAPKSQLLPALTAQEILKLLRIAPEQHFTKPPPRYSDASLVKTLEELGIGRPSTYAPTIHTILDRNYVQRQAAALMPTELGEIVTDLLVQHFPAILDTKFTAQMEGELDGVEEGKMDWVKCVREFYAPFQGAVAQAQAGMESVKKQVVETGESCPQCQRPIVIKWGRHGKFLSCSGFPECKYAKTITTGVKCPEPNCTGELVARRSKRGSFYGCSSYPDCRHVQKTLQPSPNTDSSSADSSPAIAE
ncbi:MAG: type I DNA topoisomerase [Candidatus Omnitrophica bacterium]|nr:type I DNA topoisomerase [Candidatus Omnitrophota bacterium]